MIVVDLLCASTHRFEGWFPSAEALEAQLAQGAVRCPLCGSAEVRRLPSAPYVHTGERGADTPEPSPPAPAPATVAPDPQRLAQLWQTLRALEDAPPYPVTISGELQALAARLDAEAH